MGELSDIVNSTGKFCKDLAVKGKEINYTLVIGTAVSMVANISSIYIARQIGASEEDIRNISYLAETTGYTLTTIPTYLQAERNSGVEFKQSVINLMKMGAVSCLISIGPYRMARSEMMEFLVNNQWSFEMAAAASQATLLVPFGVGIKIGGKIFNYLGDNIKNGTHKSLELMTESYKKFRDS